MSKTVLIHTLGNRDIQFSSEAKLSAKITETYLSKNTEVGSEYFRHIRKSTYDTDSEKKLGFRQICKILEERIRKGDEDLKTAMKFPMLEKAGEFVLNQAAVQRIDKLILCPTRQDKPHPMDTDHLAPLAQRFVKGLYSRKHLIDHIEVKPIPINPQNPKAKLKMYEAIENLYTELEAEHFDKIYVSNRQGLPDVTNAFDLMGLFRGYEFLVIRSGSGQGVQIDDRGAQEQYLAKMLKDKDLEKYI